jgi:hypothetical protein
VVGRPANFSGAIGSFQVAMRAEPRTLLAGEPLVLTIRITCTGSVEQIDRPDLNRLPRFAKQFLIKDLADRSLPKERAREFDYSLRPRSASVKQIPRLPFIFFKPGAGPTAGEYETTYAPAIPLTVRPRTAVQASQVQGADVPSDIPDSVYQIAEGPQVLRRVAVFAVPGPIILAACLLAPPCACMFWYAAWRRRHPDAGRLNRRRRSRAAQEALQNLGRLETVPVDQRAERARQILTEYLRQRFDLAVSEPTPLEVATYLAGLGLSSSSVQEVTGLFIACDAARFAPGLTAEQDDWSAVAGHLVNSLEGEPWSSQAA